MRINFQPLKKEHFSLLLKWLQTPHVKEWWDKDIIWTLELIEEKYGAYTEGYKLEQGLRKEIHAYIIILNDTAVGYIQFYNAYDFPREEGLTLKELPKSLAAIDIFIGDKAYIGKGLSALIMDQFLKDYVDPNYDACFVDPDSRNIAAIRAYEKVGFQHINTIHHSEWMVRKRKEKI